MLTQVDGLYCFLYRRESSASQGYAPRKLISPGPSVRLPPENSPGHSDGRYVVASLFPGRMPNIALVWEGSLEPSAHASVPSARVMVLLRQCLSNMVWMNPCGLPAATLSLVRSALSSGVRFVFQYVVVPALLPQLDPPDDPRLERNCCLANFLILRPAVMKCKPPHLRGEPAEGPGARRSIASNRLGSTHWNPLKSHWAISPPRKDGPQLLTASHWPPEWCFARTPLERSRCAEPVRWDSHLFLGASTSRRPNIRRSGASLGEETRSRTPG